VNDIYTKYKNDIDSQVAYAARKYGGNLPSSVAKAHAKLLAQKAMKNYSPDKGNVKTYLSKRLQKLSRIAYKASTPLNIPESRLMSRAKIRDFVDEYKDSFGRHPTAEEISSATGIKHSDAKNYIHESASITNESSFDNISDRSAKYISEESIIASLPHDLRNIAEDIYINGKKEKDILSDHKIGRTSYYAKKKKINSFIQEHSGLANIEYR